MARRHARRTSAIERGPPSSFDRLSCDEATPPHDSAATTLMPIGSASTAGHRTGFSPSAARKRKARRLLKRRRTPGLLPGPTVLGDASLPDPSDGRGTLVVRQDAASPLRSVAPVTPTRRSVSIRGKSTRLPAGPRFRSHPNNRFTNAPDSAILGRSVPRGAESEPSELSGR